MSVRPVFLGPFSVFVLLLISSVGVQSCDAFTPTLGSKGTQWGPVQLIPTLGSSRFHISVRLSEQLSVSLFGCLYRLLEIIHAAHNCVQSMWLNATG